MNISMIPNNDVKTIHASQNDTQRKWEFTPFANGKALVSDLPMYIKSLKGNTLVWNQLVQNGNFADTNSWDKYNCTLSVSNNVATITATATSGNIYTPTSLRFAPSNGDKVLVCGKIRAGTGTARLRFNIGGTINVTENATTTWQTVANIVTAGSSGIGYVEMYAFNSGTAEYKDVMVFNLTKMGLDVTADQFRALFPLPYYQFDSGSLLSFNGNAIKTVGKNQLKTPSSAALNGITFNVGTDGQIQITGTATAQTDFYLYGASGRYDDMGIISSTYTFSCRKDSTTTGLNFFLVGQQTGTKIGVQLDNTSLSQTVALDGSDKYRVFMRVSNGTTINTKVALQLEFGSTATDYEPFTENTANLPTLTYFPTGMKSAGSVYDELTPSKAITRVGSVDLGSFTWSNPSAAAGTTATWTQATEALSDSKYSTDPAYLSNGTCIYTMETANGVYSGRTDNSICINQVGRVQMRSSAFLNKTGTEIKALLSGVYLYYELATPTEEDVNLNLTYPIEDGGTEELLPSGLMNGSVDLGSLTWTYASNYKVFICDSFTGAKGTAQQTQVPNMECAIYRIGSWSEIATDETKDMAVCLLASANQLRIRNLAYTDATTFKNAMNGITLWYEKADSTPTTSPIRMDVVEPNGDDSTESFTYKATDASFANGTYTMVCKNLEIPLTASKGKLTGTSVIGMTNEPGFFDAKLKMTDSDGVCYSTKFQLHVERKP